MLGHECCKGMYGYGPLDPGVANVTSLKEDGVKRPERTKVCVICSVSASEKECMKATILLSSLGAEVITPFDDRSGSLYTRQTNYLGIIDEADLVVAIPKYGTRVECDTTGTSIIYKFGECVSYELAYAKHIGKPVLIWAEGGLKDEN